MAAPLTMRLILFIDVMVATILWATFVHTLWSARPASIRVVFIGLAGVLGYALVGQAKAYDLGIPFDAVSWFGLAAVSVLNAGMVWTIARDQRE